MNPEPPVQNELTEAWDAVTSKLISPVVQTAPICEVVSSALVLLGEHGLGQYLEGWLLETLQANLTTDVVPEFWTRLRQSESLLEERDRARALLEAFRCLLERLDPFLGGLERLGSWQDEGCGGLSGPGVRGLTERAFSVICALLLFTPPPVLQTRVLEFYSRTFSVHMSQKATDLSSAEGDGSCLCPGCSAAPQFCWCQEALDHLQEFSQILSRLQLLELVSSDAVTSILHQLIEKRMEQRCRGEFETSFLMDFNEWLGQVLEWLRKVFASEVEEMVPSESTTDEAPPSGLLRRWHCHMRQFFYRIYVSMRIEELFSIIRDFPESTPAIEDLKFCLDRTNQRPQLLASLKSAFETRLLHPGVHTSDIITVYISAIKALRELDPSMVILQVACQPIRKYLRTREDTVRQIVDSLTGDTEACSDLASELSRADPVALETQDSEDEETDPEEWTPDPTDALTDKTGSKRRSSDIITLLVSIYGSKEIFINEYKTVLADRLLHQLTYNTAREIRNVELLKLRFGESHMHYCEVMLKDVADSRRINTNIREEESRLPPDEQSTLPLSALIISSEFWPQLKEEKMELPAVVSKAMENYSQRFEKLKAMRTLKWNPQLGSVTLDVELEDRTISKLNVSPLHAAILLHFQERGQWSVEELSGVLGVPQELLLRKMSLWLQQGVLQELSGGFYSVQETSSSRERADKNLVLMDHDEDSDSSTAIMSEQREEKLQLFWAYIQAMLTNLECMTLERIHTMLRMFVAAGPGVTEMDIGELQTFLQKKIRVHQLVVSAGVYRLPKASQ